MNDSVIHKVIKIPRSQEANQILREEQRKNILNAARRAFVRKGYMATMEDVAAEAGVSQGLAYRYFSSKDGIMALLVKETMASIPLTEVLVEKIPGSPGQRLEQIITRIARSRQENPGYYEFLYRILADEKTPEELRRAVRHNGRELQNSMRKLIVEGQKTGEVAKDDPDQLITAIFGCLEGSWRMASFAISGEKLAPFPDPSIIIRLIRNCQGNHPHQEDTQ